jgi:ribosomal protein S20
MENPENFSNLEKRVYKHLLRKKIAHALKELEYINDKIIDGALSTKIIHKNWGERSRTREVAGSNPARSTK